MHNISITYYLTHKYIYFSIGNYSCLVAKFHLSRSIGFHMVQSYIPTMLIVIISWVSFWMEPDAVPGRITLGVTTLLTVSSKSAGKFGFFFICVSTQNKSHTHFLLFLLFQAQKCHKSHMLKPLIFGWEPVQLSFF